MPRTAELILDLIATIEIIGVASERSQRDDEGVRGTSRVGLTAASAF
jgi:hypothetical protein